MSKPIPKPGPSTSPYARLRRQKPWIGDGTAYAGRLGPRAPFGLALDEKSEFDAGHSLCTGMVTLPGKDVLEEEYKIRQRSFDSPLRAQRRAAAQVARDPRTGMCGSSARRAPSLNAARLSSLRKRSNN